MELPQLFGSREVLERARELTSNPEALKAVARLEEIYEILKLYGCEKYISFDFGMVSKIRYYTGIIFQAYTYGTGEPLIKGGRYDKLMQHFGKPAPATGFVIVVDSLLTALSRQKIRMEETEPTVMITYTRGEREQAIRQAAELRKEGKHVALKLEEDTEQ